MSPPKITATNLPAKHKGARNELAAVCWLLDRGYEVFQNVSRHGPINLIALKDGEVTYFDVTATLKETASPQQIELGVKLLVPVGPASFTIRDPRPALPDVVCYCGKKIKARRPNQRFCSNTCRNTFNRQRYAERRSGAPGRAFPVEATEITSRTR